MSEAYKPIEVHQTTVMLIYVYAITHKLNFEDYLGSFRTAISNSIDKIQPVLQRFKLRSCNVETDEQSEFGINFPTKIR